MHYTSGMRYWLLLVSIGAIVVAQSIPGTDATCSVKMPRAAILSPSDSKMVMPVDKDAKMPQATVPAPECAAATPTVQRASLSPVPQIPLVLQAPTPRNRFGELVKFPKIFQAPSSEKPGSAAPVLRLHQ